MFALIPFLFIVLPYLVWNFNFAQNKVLSNFEIIDCISDDGVCEFKNGTEVNLLIETEYQESLTIGYLEINGNPYSFNEREILCYNDECTKVTVVYEIVSNDKKIVLSNVKLYNRGIFHIGSMLDLDSKNEIDIIVRD